jgi:putative peptidoglycan binding protein
MKKVILIVLAIGLRTAAADVVEIVCDRPFFHATDSLAPRDDWGLLHQSRTVYETDFAPRYHWRPFYYLESGRELIAQPAYVGALQRDLRRLGYYCGPIDGVFSDEVSDAIARLQKNYSMRVTGTLTIPVRRVLFLP